MDKLHAIVQSLQNRRPLARKHEDHPLTGKWEGWRDCHVEPDWVLIYKTSSDTLTLGRTGSHSDLSF